MRWRLLRAAKMEEVRLSRLYNPPKFSRRNKRAFGRQYGVRTKPYRLMSTADEREFYHWCFKQRALKAATR